MDVSAKMPAVQDSKLDARMPAVMKSEAPPTGGDGPHDAPQQGDMSQTTNPGVDWQANNDDRGAEWECEDRKTGEAWELTPRKEEGNKGGRPQATNL